MAYSDISIVAPSSARDGEMVAVEVRVKNLVNYTIYAIPVLRVDGVWAEEGSYEAITPGQIRVWNFSFIMPSKSITLTAESWCESSDYYYFEWHLDDIATQGINLEELKSQFRGFAFQEYIKAYGGLQKWNRTLELHWQES